MSANIRIRFGLQIVLVCLYSTPLSPLCKLIWRHWTSKMPVRYILSSVWVRLSICFPLSIIQYVGLYVFSLPISLVMIERIYILCLIIIKKSEVWTITHCLGLGHETMVSVVCLSIFLWGPSGDDRTQVSPMLAPWTLLSGYVSPLNISPRDGWCTYIYTDRIALKFDRHLDWKRVNLNLVASRLHEIFS